MKTAGGCSGGTVGGPSQSKVTLVQQLQQLLLRGPAQRSDVHLAGDLHGRSQVPHLDAAVAMATEQVTTGTRADPTGAFTLMNHEGRDGGPIHRAHLTHPLPVRGQSDVEFVSIRNNSLDEHLLLVSFSVRSNLGPGAAAVSVDLVQAEDLEGGERRGSWLGGDHPSESSHRPGPYMVVICTD